MPRWATFPHDATAFRRTLPALKKAWPRLHRGDAEPWPTSKPVQQAWALFHAGEFQAAFDAGLAEGSPAGLTVANKAQAIHATHLQPGEAQRLAALQAVARRARALAAGHPDCANAHYWLAYALGRYSQGISITQALAQGLGHQVKAALETTLELAPRHADAHIALGLFHAEVIDKVGPLLGAVQGADAATGQALLERGLALNPDSPIAMIECANGLVMLQGHDGLPRAEALYAQAAALTPADAMECLDVELAKAELADE